MSNKLNIIESSSNSVVQAINRNRRSLRERLNSPLGSVGNAVRGVVGGGQQQSVLVVGDVQQQQQQRSRSVDSATTSGATAAKSSNENSITKESDERKQSSSQSDVIAITIGASDTLTGLAARYDTTPGELQKLNKLSSRLIFPGQQLLVPKNSEESNDSEVFEVPTKVTTSVAEKKFVKILVKHVTDGNGVVTGTLLITPNAVMFDPLVIDPLVIERGPEAYGVILPLSSICHCGIFSDIAAMKVERGVVSNYQEKPKLFGATPKEKTSKKDANKKKIKRLSFPLSWMEASGEETGFLHQTNLSAPPTAGHDKKTFDESESSGGGGVVKLRRSFERLLSTSPPRNLPPAPPPEPPQQEEEEFTTVDQSPEWYLLLTSCRAINEKQAQNPHQLIVSYGTKNYLRPEYWFNICKREQVFELYEFLKGLGFYYGVEPEGEETLTLRNLQLITFQSMHLVNEREIDDELPTKGELKESWEMIKSPYTKISSFLNRSSTLLTSTSSQATNFGQSVLDSISDFATIEDVEGEEVVSMSPSFNPKMFLIEDYVPELHGKSEILIEVDLKELGRVLTPRAEGHPLSLIHSTTHDGFSLSTLLRKNALLTMETPILLVIQDTRDNVFGALLSSPLVALSDNFYGTGQSFLFRIDRKEDSSPPTSIRSVDVGGGKRLFERYAWTGKNEYFISVREGVGVAVGAGEGHFGIWLDADLNCGRTDECSTFNNPRLVEGEDGDFVIKILECWAFLQ